MLSESCIPNVTNLINKSKSKKFRNKQRIEPPKCNYINKVTCPLKGKCQNECIVYKVEFYSCRLNDSNVGCNDKKSICRFYTRTSLKRYYNHMSSFTHEIYRHRISLYNYVWEIKKNLGMDSILKRNIVKSIVKKGEVMDIATMDGGKNSNSFL